MARTPAQRGKIGNWLVESRLARGWDTQDRARAEIERLTGWRVPQSVYAEWESGRRVPSDANLERLQGFYGDGPGLGSTGSDDPVATAIREQTKVLSELVAELREGRAVEARLRAVEAGVALLAQRADVELPDPIVPQV